MQHLRTFWVGLFLAILVTAPHHQAQGQNRPLAQTTYQPVEWSMGFAVPLCAVKTQPDLRPSTCSGYRIDYVGSWNIVMAVETYSVKFADNFVNKFVHSDFAIGYRFDIAHLIARLRKTTLNPYFAPLYFAYFPYFLASNVSTIFTTAYKYQDISAGAVSDRFEVGWRVGQSTDIFLHFFSSQLGSFTIQRPDRVEQAKISIRVLFVGFHYGF